SRTLAERPSTVSPATFTLVRTPLPAGASVPVQFAPPITSRCALPPLVSENTGDAPSFNGPAIGSVRAQVQPTVKAKVEAGAPPTTRLWTVIVARANSRVTSSTWGSPSRRVTAGESVTAVASETECLVNVHTAFAGSVHTSEYPSPGV